LEKVEKNKVEAKKCQHINFIIPIKPFEAMWHLLFSIIR